MSAKPRLRAYVVGPGTVDLDVFYTLPTALGAEWTFQHLVLERAAFTLELVSDVHRDHGIRNAIIVIVPSEPRGYHRLAIAHAWRAGVRRFILLVADKSAPSEAATHELEQELRVLLDELGDGGAAPCVRTALTRCAGGTPKDMRDAMRRLIGEIERVFPPEEPDVVDAPLPASFATEAAILDAVAPLVRSATMIGERAATLAETAALRDGAGGSHKRGWPYLPATESPPTCPTCRREIACYLQLDMRDVLHAPPPSHRLFVIYRCGRCGSSQNVVIRHYDAPSAAAARKLEDLAADDGEAQILVMERLAHMLPDGELVETSFPDVVAQLQQLDDNWGRLYWWAETAMGGRSLRIPDHLGGWHTSRSSSLLTCACDSPLYLVSSTQWGDWWNTVWACPIHADLALHDRHK